MSKKVTIFVHQQNRGSCLFGHILDSIGLEVETIRANLVDVRETDGADCDLLLVMGGPIGVYQADDYPFLYDEIDIVKRRIDRELPTLGVCLGSQIIANALGSQVYPGANGKEVGWGELTVNDAGMQTPVRHYDKSKTKIFQWHGDTFDFPEGATLLASSDQYEHQIFTYGKNIMALQCHPEMTEDKLMEWYVGLVREITGPDPVIPLSVLRTDSEKYIRTAQQQSEKFLLEWLEQIGMGSFT